MPIEDFGYGGTSSEEVTDITTGNGNAPIPPEEDPKDGNGNNNEPPAENKPEPHVDDNGNKDGDNNGNNDERLEAGTIVEIGDNKYTVNDNGDLVTETGEVFKKADEVKSYLASLEENTRAETEELSISNIINSVGVDIIDEAGKPVEFDNTPEGINAYINSVMEVRADEIREAQMNSLYQEVPILKDVINYYFANGKSLKGFNELPDRSNIEIDINDTAQQEAIIRQSFKEFGKRGDIDGYIAYLKSSGMLAETAKEELAALQEADKQAKEILEKEAEENVRKEQEKLVAYWNGVKSTIDSRKIAGYEIPTNFIIEKDGKKLSATPNDFFNYVYQIDENGISRYQKDLAKLSPEQRRDDELLRAYLTFTGGSYANLVEMTAKKEEVKRLRYKSNKQAPSGVKITKPEDTKPKSTNIDFGY